MTNSCNDLLGNNNCAEVVGSNLTRSISFILGNYGIESGLFLGHCRIKALQYQYCILRYPTFQPPIVILLILLIPVGALLPSHSKNLDMTSPFGCSSSSETAIKLLRGAIIPTRACTKVCKAYGCGCLITMVFSKVHCHTFASSIFFSTHLNLRPYNAASWKRSNEPFTCISSRYCFGRVWQCYCCGSFMGYLHLLRFIYHIFYHWCVYRPTANGFSPNSTLVVVTFKDVLLSDIVVVAVVEPSPVILSYIDDATAVDTGIIELKPSNDAIAKNINGVIPAKLSLTL